MKNSATVVPGHFGAKGHDYRHDLVPFFNAVLGFDESPERVGADHRAPRAAGAEPDAVDRVPQSGRARASPPPWRSAGWRRSARRVGIPTPRSRHRCVPSWPRWTTSIRRKPRRFSAPVDPRDDVAGALGDGERVGTFTVVGPLPELGGQVGGGFGAVKLGVGADAGDVVVKRAHARAGSRSATVGVDRQRPNVTYRGAHAPAAAEHLTLGLSDAAEVSVGGGRAPRARPGCPAPEAARLRRRRRGSPTLVMERLGGRRPETWEDVARGARIARASREWATWTITGI